ncbi:MAG TPA: CRISPR-associated helicase Cas3', partial [Gaiellales bacterium]|nr:CRISPR-associated helicase Cas3' [Gaiellales bacterium]
LARRLAALSGSDELYFALPTQATSNQMFGRVHQFLNASDASPVPVKLVHGQALLFADDIAEHPYGDGADAESPAAAVPAWFAPKKRALVAPYGVGTIDQAELAVLNARHYMLRLFGLAGKVVILDEVHAYDAYMSTIIEHALWWLAALGTSVILLSATLPTRRHRQLANAFLAGVRGHVPDAAPADDGAPLPYPVLSAYTSSCSTMGTPPAAQPDRELTLEMTPDRSAVAEARYLLELVRDGGAVCRITNTVARAQEVAAALREIAPRDVERHLLHARLPSDDRLAREVRLADRLGPTSTRTPSDRIVVVGTQVLEQSLDYDVDVMLSDLAPIDLLLQRAGRLHRHAARLRPRLLREPVLQVVLGTDARGAPGFGASRFVYEPFVLWKTWLTLHARQEADGHIVLHLPADYRALIEATYDDRRDVLAADQPFRPLLDAAWEEYRRDQAAMHDSARQRLIPDPDPDLPITEGAPFVFEEDEDGGKQGWGVAATRYGRQSITVIPLHRVANGVAIGPGEPPLTAVSCDRSCQLRLLRRAIRIGHPGLVAQLPKSVVPELGWMTRQPLLRYHVPLVLDDGRAEIGGVVIRLDSELGLVIGREAIP